jgi:hypothetical protein
MNWQLEFNLHWPHDRCAVGWEYIGPTEKENEDINTFTVYLFILTINFHVYN